MLAQSASDSTGHEQLFSAGVKRYLFSHCLRRMVKSWLFRKLFFQPPFSQFSRIPPQEAERAPSVADSIYIGKKVVEK
jgi:hypothetical protein